MSGYTLKMCQREKYTVKIIIKQQLLDVTVSLSSFTYWAPQGADSMVRWAPQGQVCIFNFTICIYSNTACIFNNTRIFIISAICSYFVNFISLLYIRLVSYYALLSHSNCEHIISSGFHFWWSCPLIVLFDTAPS